MRNKPRKNQAGCDMASPRRSPSSGGTGPDFLGGIKGIAAMAVICHLCAFASIFDIYFRSPIVNGLEPVDPPAGASAKRVIIIVGDGCRSDMFFEEAQWVDEEAWGGGKGKAGGFLRKKILDGQTSWGVSHTRVPTESRPCHASLMGGIYEDPSAVTKGWQANPVEFDTVINASTAAFAFGSPDVVPLFAKGLDHVTGDMYPPDWEDFGAACHDKEMGCKRLDDWVVNRLATLFKDSKKDPELRARLGGQRVVIFLHLLGLDMNGHAHRPASRQYRDNIRFVDKLVQRVESMVDKHYGDKKTAYVFTADHGMSNKGSHGDGEPECTQTPLVVWGAGVSETHPVRGDGEAAGHRGKGVIPETPRGEGGDGWGDLLRVERKDVEQAQIAPLVSALMGSHMPVNNVGTVPLPYIHAPAYSSRHARLLLQNSIQILRVLELKEALKRKTTFSATFRPYPPSKGGALQRMVKEIEAGIEEGGKYAEIEERCRGLISTLLRGLTYYDTYDRSFLQFVIVAAYMGGAALLLEYVSSFYYPHVNALQASSGDYKPSREAQYITLAAAALIVIQGSTWHYILYVALSVYLWDQAIKGWKRCGVPTTAFAELIPTRAQGWGVLLGGAMVLEMMILGFADRAYYTLGHLIVGLVGFCALKGSWDGRYFWAIACMGASVFTLLSVEFGDEMRMVYLGGLLLVGAAMGAEKHARECGEDDAAHLFVIQAAMGGLAIVSLRFSVESLEAQRGLPIILWLLNWALLAGCIIAPTIMMRVSDYWVNRLVSLYVGWGVPYMMLSVNYETLFYCFLCSQLGLWVLLERDTRASEVPKGIQGGVQARIISQSQTLKGAVNPLRDAATSLAVLFFLDASFFGTGNIASVSSFELKSVYRFMAVFNPFLMGGMLLFKIALPFVLVAATFRTVTALENINTTVVLSLLLILADIMSLHFFFSIRTEGSWKDIGQSISIFGITNFIIIMVLCLFISTERIARGASYKPGGTDNGKSISDALGGFSWLQKLPLLFSR